VPELGLSEDVFAGDGAAAEEPQAEAAPEAEAVAGMPEESAAENDADTELPAAAEQPDAEAASDGDAPEAEAEAPAEPAEDPTPQA